MVNLDELQVMHLPEQGRFEIRAGGQTAVLTYHLQGGTITFLHTGVPPELEGGGIGSKLAQAGLDYARAKGLKIQSECSFMSRYLKRHPETRA